MQKFADAYSSIPTDHLGLLIALTAVVGGLTLLGVIVCRGMTVHARAAAARMELVQQMLAAGLSSSEILSVLDHPAIAQLTWSQKKHSKPLREAIEAKPPRVAGKAAVGAGKLQLG